MYCKIQKIISGHFKVGQLWPPPSGPVPCTAIIKDVLKMIDQSPRNLIHSLFEIHEVRF